jgi:thioredoxin 2
MTDATESNAIQYACAHCGRTNRILRERLLDDPTCGACKLKIFPNSPVTVTDSNWPQQVDACPIPVLVDFWAPWCAPCRTVAPLLEQIAAERAGRLKVAKLNVDENPQLAARFQVGAIPMLMIFRGPLLVDEIRGAVPKATIEAHLSRVA